MLVVRAALALLINFVGVTVGPLVIHREPLRRTARRWRNMIMSTLLIEWIFLLAFALVWLMTGSLIHQRAGQIVLLGLAAFGMGIQGAVVIAFGFPGVVANAMTAVVLVLGHSGMRRVIAGRSIAHSGQAGEWRWTFLLPVIYALGAVAVGLTSNWPLTPLIISTIDIIYVFTRVGVNKVER